VTDGELIKLYLQNGDESAFTKLYQRYRKPVYSYLNDLLPGRPHAADDIFQRTWLRVIDRLCKYKEQGSFLAWILRIAHNFVMDLFRREKRFCSDENPDSRADDAPLPQDEYGDREVKEALEHAVFRLPTEQLEVVRLRQSGVSFAEIAGIQGVSINTALGRMHYAVQRLRKDLAEFIQ
jgi:RNA polymerase sigma-70 factor (ECF subfamily)